MSPNLNGSAALAESIRIQLGNVRRDWSVSEAHMRARLAEGLLELERTCSLMRERLEQVQDGAPGKPGEPGAPGKVDPIELARMIDEAVAKLPPAKDGKSVDRAEVESMVELAVVNAIAAMPVPQDGKPGEPGKSVDMVEVRRMIADAVAELPKPKDGEPGKPGERGPPGLFEAPTPFKPGAITYENELVYHEGSTFIAKCDTAATPPHEDFQPVAFKGRDAYAGRALGLFDDTRTDYRAMDVVTLNGSEWRAVKDNPGACPGDGWVLGAKKGKPGDKGDKGDKGDSIKGDKGEPGDGFVHVERIESSLVFTRVDGSAVSIDLGTLVA